MFRRRRQSAGSFLNGDIMRQKRGSMVLYISTVVFFAFLFCSCGGLPCARFPGGGAAAVLWIEDPYDGLFLVILDTAEAVCITADGDTEVIEGSDTHVFWYVDPEAGEGGGNDGGIWQMKS